MKTWIAWGSCCFACEFLYIDAACVHSYIHFLRIFIQISGNKNHLSIAWQLIKIKLSFPKASRTKSITVAYLFFISISKKSDIFFYNTFAHVLYGWWRGNAQMPQMYTPNKDKEICSVVKVRIVNIFPFWMETNACQREERRDSCYIIYLFVCPISVNLWQQKLPLISV